MYESKIDTVSRETLIKLIDDNNNLKGIILEIGYASTQIYLYKKLKDRLKKENLLEYLQNKNYKRKSLVKKTDNEIFCEKSNYHRGCLKTKIIKNNIISYECKMCGNKGEWLGQKMNLTIDHINGINNDNRIKNLRFLCYNCHALTPTYAGKNAKRQKMKFLCPTCNKSITRGAKKCNECSAKDQWQFTTDKEELEDLILVQKKSYVELGRKFGVSDNAVKKRAQRMGIELPKRKLRIQKSI